VSQLLLGAFDAKEETKGEREKRRRRSTDMIGVQVRCNLSLHAISILKQLLFVVEELFPGLGGELGILA